MKKENLNQKKRIMGITLVALVVTIVVLLILAGITITMLFSDNGIITKAREAADTVDKAQGDTINGLGNLEENMTDALSDGKWKDNGNGTLISGSKIVTIGDYVDYDPGSHTHTPDLNKGAGTGWVRVGNSTPHTLRTSQVSTQTNLKWRVLGANSKGQLELISSDPTTQVLHLANDTGWVNAENNLDKFCDDLYGKGTIEIDGKNEKIAVGARSLNLDDVDKLAKYDKTKVQRYGQIFQYGFPVNGSYMQYRTREKGNNTLWSEWKDVTSEGFQNFRTPEDSTMINIDNPGVGKELENTYYSYKVPNEITTSDGYTKNLATTIIDMITKGTGNSHKYQWLATTSVYNMGSYTGFYIGVLSDSNGNYGEMFRSYGWYYDWDYYVRPVITLESGVKLSGNGDNLGTADNPYTISK